MKKIWTEEVTKDQIDYNNHLRDHVYIDIFNKGLKKFWEKSIKVESANIKTVESHVAYLDQAELKDELTVLMSVLDYNKNEAHIWLVMKKSTGVQIATMEELVRTEKEIEVFSNNEEIKGYVSTDEDYPEEAGKKIEIKRKK